MSKEHAYAYETGYRDGSIHYELEHCPVCKNVSDLQEARDEITSLREQLESLQPTDGEGNVLDIADTVRMLRSEYDGDHEWDDVVVELALTKWGGDRWIVRGSKGEAWACDCLRTGHDEDAYEGSDDAEPTVNPTLMRDAADTIEELEKERQSKTCHAVGMDCFGNPPWNKSRLSGNSDAVGCSECGVPWSGSGLFRGNKLRHNFVACPICGRRIVSWQS